MANWKLRVSAVVLLLLALGTCEAQTVFEGNPAVIDPAVPGHVTLGKGGYRLPALTNNKTWPGLLMLLALSGGGKRSSAFSYGILRGLHDMPVHISGTTHSLLDLVDGIGSVSGSTFTAAYYGLYRDRLFTDFENDFLKRDINGYIWGTYLLPWHWGWMVHARWGSNDRMASVYDDLMFHGATYADLSKNGPPLIWIGATDISYGTVFTFNQDTFDLLCTDLGSFPLARAVAASNAFPVLFSPITIRNRVDRCGKWRPSWISQHVETDADTALRRNFLAQVADAYLDPSRTRYIHLVDGGVADNLALRGLLNEMIQFEYDSEYLRSLGLASVRRILIIVADGEAAHDTGFAKEEVLGGLGRIVQAVIGMETDRYNFETISLARLKLAEMVDHLKRLRCQISGVIEGHACDDVAGYLVHLSLAEIGEARTRQRLEKIPTGMTIDDADVDALVNAGEEQVKKSRTITEVLKDVETY